jgi:hypothetical protein
MSITSLTAFSITHPRRPPTWLAHPRSSPWPCQLTAPLALQLSWISAITLPWLVSYIEHLVDIVKTKMKTTTKTIMHIQYWEGRSGNFRHLSYISHAYWCLCYKVRGKKTKQIN